MIRADAARAVRFALCGAAAFVVVEPVVTIWQAQGPVRLATALRFFALDPYPSNTGGPKRSRNARTSAGAASGPSTYLIEWL